MFLGLKFDEWLTIISVAAILLSPVFALEVQKRLDENRSRIASKKSIFRKLMTTRASTMHPVHVEALNSIEVEFYATEGEDKKVLDAWRLYVTHMNVQRKLEGAELDRWAEEKKRLLVDLLYEMAQALDYPEISKATIKNDTYYPQGYVDIEQEQPSPGSNKTTPNQQLQDLGSLRSRHGNSCRDLLRLHGLV
jgi:hypothetical protein